MEMDETRKEIRNLALAILALVAITILVYLPSLKNQFTNWDDDKILLNFAMIQELSWTNLVAIFSSMHYAHYHPLVTLSFAFEYHLFGFDPTVYHLTNVLLHALTTICVFWFVRVLKGGIMLPFVVALLFGVHPIHVESVAWITERKDVLYAPFYLGAMIAYVAYTKSRKPQYFVIVTITFLCALLSKSMAVTLPVVLLLLDYFADRSFGMRIFIEKTLWFALSLVFGVIGIIGQYHMNNVAPSASFSIDNILIASHGILFYLQKLILPFNLSNVYPVPVKVNGMLPPIFFASPFLVAALILLILWFPKRDRTMLFCCSFFLVVLLPVLQLTPVGGVLAADRFVYLASLGVFLLVGDKGIELFRRRATNARLATVTSLGFLALVILPYSYLTWERTKVWRDSLSLWNDALNQFASITVGYWNRGNALTDLGQVDRAIEDYNSGLKLAPNDVDLHFNRANAYRLKGEHQLSLADYAIVIKMRPNQPDAYNNRGMVYSQMGQYEKAIEDFNIAIQLNPGNAGYYNGRGICFAELRRFDVALADFDSATSKAPQYDQPYFNRALVFGEMNKWDLKRADLDKAIFLNPTDPDFYVQRAAVAVAKGELDTAIADYNRAIERSGSNPKIFNSRGVVYYRKKEFGKAIKDFSEALRISPQYADAYSYRAYAFIGLNQFSSARQDVDSLKALGQPIDNTLLQQLSKGKGH